MRDRERSGVGERSCRSTRWLRGLAFVLGVALPACFAVPPRPDLQTAGHGAAELPCALDVISWNVHKQATAIADSELQALTEGAHLVVLQESTDPKTRSGLPPVTSYVVAFRRSRDDRPAGVATASVADPVSTDGVYSPDREPFARTPKSALLSTFALAGGERLLVINLHAINFRLAAALERQLSALEPRITAHEGPVIVAGDFNTWSGRRRRVVQGFARRMDLIPAFSGPDAPRLDQIYVRGLAFDSEEVIPTQTSDHDALRVGLRCR